MQPAMQFNTQKSMATSVTSKKQYNSVKLVDNDHGYNEFTAITKKCNWNFRSQMVNLVKLKHSSRL